jgi:hypothetical protein
VWKDTCSVQYVSATANAARVPEFPVLESSIIRIFSVDVNLSGLVPFRDGFRFSGIPSKSPVIGPAFHPISTTIFYRLGLARRTRTRSPFFGSFPLLCLTYLSYSRFLRFPSAHTSREKPQILWLWQQNAILFPAAESKWPVHPVDRV